MKDLNLIPKSYYLQEKKKKRRLYLTAGITAFTGFAVLAVALPFLWRMQLEIQKKTYENMVKQTSSYVETERQFGILRKMYEDRQVEADAMLIQMADVDGVFDSIQTAVPDKVFFLSMDVEAEDNGGITVSLDGVSASIDGIATFISKIRDNGYFDNIMISTVDSAVLPKPEPEPEPELPESEEVLPEEENGLTGIEQNASLTQNEIDMIEEAEQEDVIYYMFKVEIQKSGNLNTAEKK